jgi:hypothetical protein
MAFWYPFKHRILNCTILSSRRRHLHSTLSHKVHYQVLKHTANMAPIFKIATFLSRMSPSHFLPSQASLTLKKSPSTSLPKAHNSSPAPAPQTPNAPPPAVVSHPANVPRPSSPTSAVKAAVSAPQHQTTTLSAEAPSQPLVRQTEVRL